MFESKINCFSIQMGHLPYCECVEEGVCVCVCVCADVRIQACFITFNLMISLYVTDVK